MVIKPGRLFLVVLAKDYREVVVVEGLALLAQNYAIHNLIPLITDMALDPQGNLYLCAYKLWKVDPRDPPFSYRQLSKKAELLTGLAVSEGGDRLYCGNKKGVLKVFDLHSLKRIKKVRCFSGEMLDIQLLEQGMLVLASETQVLIWSEKYDVEVFRYENKELFLCGVQCDLQGYFLVTIAEDWTLLQEHDLLPAIGQARGVAEQVAATSDIAQLFSYREMARLVDLCYSDDLQGLPQLLPTNRMRKYYFNAAVLYGKKQAV